MSPLEQVFGRFDPKHPFLYQTPRNIRKVAYALDVTETAGHQAGRVSLSIDVVF